MKIFYRLLCILGDKNKIGFFFFNFSYDYLKITDGKSHTFGVYCGEKTGESVVVAGDQVMITFYSDDIEQRRGFLIFFTPIPVGR